MAQILKLFFLIKIQTYGNSDWIGSLKSATLTKILTCGFKQVPKLNNTSTSINLFIQKFIHKFNLVYIFLFFFFLKKPTYWECMGATLNFGKNTISTFLHTWFRITEYLWIHMQEKLWSCSIDLPWEDCTEAEKAIWVVMVSFTVLHETWSIMRSNLTLCEEGGVEIFGDALIFWIFFSFF